MRGEIYFQDPMLELLPIEETCGVIDPEEVFTHTLHKNAVPPSPKPAFCNALKFTKLYSILLNGRFPGRAASVHAYGVVHEVMKGAVGTRASGDTVCCSTTGAGRTDTT